MKKKLKIILMATFLLAYSITSCGSTDNPPNGDKLPFGVFPLNDVK
jgi:hypothetical protein